MRKKCENLHTFMLMRGAEKVQWANEKQTYVKISGKSVGKPRRRCRGLFRMFFKRDYRVENWGGQVEHWSLMCKERIRHWVDLTGLCSLCAEEPINWVHADHLHVNIWCMHMLPQAQSACKNIVCHNNVLLNTSALADQCLRMANRGMRWWIYSYRLKNDIIRMMS